MELAKTRDFGEIISDSFIFIRQNFKPLLSCFFVFCGFFILAGAVAGIMQQIKVAQVLDSVDYTTINNTTNWAAFGIETVLALAFTLLIYVAMPVAILSFMALYKVKGNVAPNNTEVWGYFKYYFLRVLGSTILNSILLIIGFVCCFIPGIYLYPIFGLIIPIMIVENTGYSYAFNQSFRLIKQNWWMVFGALFITSLIVSICSAVVTVPFQAVNVWNVFLHQVKSTHLSMLTIVIGTILRQLAQVLLILPMVALALCYFSLAESKDATGLMDRIDQLGSKSTDTNAPAEEY